MTDLDVLERLQRTTGLGTLRGPYQRKDLPRKPHWRWQLQRQMEARELMLALLPQMGKRRAARIREVLKGMRQTAAYSRGGNG